MGKRTLNTTLLRRAALACAMSLVIAIGAGAHGAAFADEGPLDVIGNAANSALQSLGLAPQADLTANAADENGLPTGFEDGMVTATADTPTQNNWRAFLENWKTEYAGNVWTDKSVTTDATTEVNAEGHPFTVSKTPGATFLTDLSALSSSEFTNLTGEVSDEGLAIGTSEGGGDAEVVFSDQLGDYMEVKDFNAIVYGTQIGERPGGGYFTELYTTHTKTSNGNVDTYVFEAAVDPVMTQGISDELRRAVLAQDWNLNRIQIEVTRSADAKTGDFVRVSIPARLIPVLEYIVGTDEEGALTLDRIEARPIHVFYSSGLKSAEGSPAGLTEDVAVTLSRHNQDLEALKADADQSSAFTSFLDHAREGHVADDGRHVLFYGNRFVAQDNAETGSTYAALDLSPNNRYYFFTEDSPVYLKTGSAGTDADYTPATPANTGAPTENELSGMLDQLYYRTSYYENEGNTESGATHKRVEYVQLTATNAYGMPAIDFEGKAMTDIFALNGEGVYQIKAGTPERWHRGHLDAKKADNATQTAEYVLRVLVSEGGYLGEEYLGNNGRIDIPMAGTLSVAKQPNTAAEGVTAPDEPFEYTISFQLGGTELDGQYAAMKRAANGKALKAQSGTGGAAEEVEVEAADEEEALVYVASGDAITLKDGQSFKVAGLPNGATYTVTQKAKETYTPAATYDSGKQTEDQSAAAQAGEELAVSGALALADTSHVEFSNDYAPAPVTVTVPAKKILQGAALQEGAYTFSLYEADGFDADTRTGTLVATGANDAEGNVELEGVTVGEGADAHNALTFAEATVADEPLHYVMVEDAPATPAPGVTYDTSVHDVVMQIVVNDSGKLEARMQFPADGEAAECATFTNVYGSTGSARIAVTKTLQGRSLTENGIFHFVLTDASGNLLTTYGEPVTTPAGATVAYEDATYEQKYENSIYNGSAAEGESSDPFYFDEIHFDSATLEADRNVEKSTDAQGHAVYTVHYRVYEMTDDLASYAVVPVGSTSRTVTVTLTDDGEGNLAPAYDYGEGAAAASFENSYEPEPVALDASLPEFADFRFQKTLTGREWLDDDVFTFEMTEDSTDGYAYAGKTPLPEGASDGLLRVDVKKEIGERISAQTNATIAFAGDTATFAFPALTFTLDDLANYAADGVTVVGHDTQRTFQYEIREAQGTTPGLRYDTVVRHVSITLYNDAMNGELKITNAVISPSRTFTNVYEATALFRGLAIQKTLVGHDMVSRGQFEFDVVPQATTADGDVAGSSAEEAAAKASSTGLSADAMTTEGMATKIVNEPTRARWVADDSIDNGSDYTGADMPKGEYRAINTKTFFNGVEFGMDDLRAPDGSYYEKRAYTYEVFESNVPLADGNGYRWDRQRATVTVEVSNADHDGQLDITTTVAKQGEEPQTYNGTAGQEGAENAAVVPFRNTYEAVAMLSGELDSAVVKTLTGRDMSANEFEFDLGYRLDQQSEPIARGYNDAASDGEEAAVYFDPISYSSRALDADSERYSPNAQRDTLRVGQTSPSAVGNARYTLTYYVMENEERLEAMEGIIPVHIETQLTVTLEDQGDGTLRVVDTREGSPFPDGVDTSRTRPLANEYATSMTSIPVIGYKDLQGALPADGQFSYSISGDTRVMKWDDGTTGRKMVSNSGTEIYFGRLTFTPSDLTDHGVTPVDGVYTDTFTYTVVENVPDGGTNGIVYDENTSRQFTVTVSWDSNTSTMTIDEEPVVADAGAAPAGLFEFHNTYQVATAYSLPTDSAAGGTPILKELAGRQLHSDTDENPGFQVGLYYATTQQLVGLGHVVADPVGPDNPDGSKGTFVMVGVDSEGNEVADGVAFTQADLLAGSRNFILREISGSDSHGVSYDATNYTIVADLSDNGDGTMKVEWVVPGEGGADRSLASAYPTGITFTNTYNATGEVDLAASKRLVGHALAEGGFRIDVKDSAGTTVASGFNGAAAENTPALVDLPALAYSVSPLDGYASLLKADGTPQDWVERVEVDDRDTASVADDQTHYYFHYTTTETMVEPEHMPMTQISGDFRVDVHLVDDGAGQLHVADLAYVEVEEGGAEKPANGIDYVNRFNFTPLAWSAADVVEGTGEDARTVVSGIDATKVLTGDHALAAGDFTYTMRNVNNEVVATGTNAADGTISFTPLPAFSEWSELRTYVYHVTEDIPDGAVLVGGSYVKDGITYDRTSFTVRVDVTEETVEVVREMDGLVTRIPTGRMTAVWYVGSTPGANELAFQNSYAATPYSSTPTATSARTTGISIVKQLSGRALRANGFTFDLFAADEYAMSGRRANPVATGTNAANGAVTLSQVRFDAAGEYDYVLVEEDSDPIHTNGITYSEATYDVHASVTDDGKGVLYVVWSVWSEGTQLDAAVFENAYTVASVSTTSMAFTKQLVGRDWRSEDRFAFTLAAETPGAPMPEGGEEGASATERVYEATAPSAGDVATVRLGTMTFAGENMEGATPARTGVGMHKTFTYSLTENLPEGTSASNPVKDGMTYDVRSAENAVKLVVEVTDSGTGYMTIDSWTFKNPANESATFCNVYDSTVTYSLVNLSKSLSGHALPANAFRFHVQAVDDASAAKFNAAGSSYTSRRQHASAADAAVDPSAAATWPLLCFSDVTFTSADAGKTFEYRVWEEDESTEHPYYTYDRHNSYANGYLVDIYVTDDAKGNISVVTTVAEPSGGIVSRAEYTPAASTPAVVPFANTYDAATPSTLPDVQAKKTMSNGDMASGTFTFELYERAGEGDDATLSTRPVATALNATGGTESDVDFAPIPYTLDELEQLVADGYGTVERSADGGNATYTIGYRAVELDTDTNGIVLESRSIKQDVASIDFTVTYADNGAGTIVPNVNYPGGAEALEFVNHYEFSAPDPITLPSLTKRLQGRPWDGTMGFGFTLTPVDGAPMPGGVASLHASVSSANIFGDIDGAVARFSFAEQFTYTGDDFQGARANPDGTLTKEFVYRVVEDVPAGAVNNRLNGIQYPNPNVRVVLYHVTLTSDSIGRITTGVSVSGEYDEANGISFNNVYSARDVSYDEVGGFTILKTLYGRDIIEGQFEFDIDAIDTPDYALALGSNFEAVDEAVTTMRMFDPAFLNADGQRVVRSVAASTNETSPAMAEMTVFQNITFTSADINKMYAFTVSERVPSGAVDNGNNTAVLDGYTYDTHSYVVTVCAVDDDHDGSMSINTNVYAADTTGGRLQKVNPDGSFSNADPGATYTFHANASDNRKAQIGFVNNYRAKSDPIDLRVEKWLYGRDLNAGEFAYTLRTSQRQTLARGTNEANDTSSPTTSYDPAKPTEPVVAPIVFGRMLTSANDDNPASDVESSGNPNEVVFKVGHNDDNVLIDNDGGLFLVHAAKTGVATMEVHDDNTIEYAMTLYIAEDTEHMPFGVTTSTSSTVRTVEVRLNDDNHGHLRLVNVSYTDGAAAGDFISDGNARAVFENQFSTDTSIKVPLTATKVLKDRATPIEPGEFMFEVRPGPMVGTGGLAPLPQFPADQVDDKHYTGADGRSPYMITTNGFDGNDSVINLGVIEDVVSLVDSQNWIAEDGFDWNDQSTFVFRRPYSYTITEIIPDDAVQAEDGRWVKDGVYYDPEPKTFEIVTRWKYFPAAGEAPVNVIVSNISITNTFENTPVLSSPTDQIEMSKELTGRALLPGGFKFRLYDTSTSGAEPTLVEEVANGASDPDDPGSIVFAPIEFTEPGVYTYLAQEYEPKTGTAERREGVTYDTTRYRLQADVTEKTDETGKETGELAVTWKVTTQGAASESKVVFSNAYASEGDVVLSAHKRLRNRLLGAGDFTFEAKYHADGTVFSTATNTAQQSDGTGLVNWPNIHFTNTDLDNMTEVGQATKAVLETTGAGDALANHDVWCVPLTLTEDESSMPAGVEAEKSGFDVTVVALDDNEAEIETRVVEGTFTADEIVAALQEKLDGGASSVGVGDLEAAALTFVNVYNPLDEGNTRSLSENYTLTKTLAGRTLEPGMFTFLLKDGDEVIDVVKNGMSKVRDADGHPVLDANGDYQFQVAGDVAEIEAPEVKFTEAGTHVYTYTLSEDTSEAKAGMTYGNEVYQVRATVTDQLDENGLPNGLLDVKWTVTSENGRGEVVTVPAGGKGEIPFTNSYEASGLLPLSAYKTLADHPLRGGAFAFELTQHDVDSAGVPLSTGDVVATAANVTAGADTPAALGFTSAATGRSISSLAYTTADLDAWVAAGKAVRVSTDAATGASTYKLFYTLAEDTSGLAAEGMSSSVDTCDFSVTVVDDGEGHLVATPDYGTASLHEGAPSFQNAYEPVSTDEPVAGSTRNAAIVGAKSITGRPDNTLTAEDIFTFELTANDGAPLRTVDGSGYKLNDSLTASNDTTGAIAFDELVFTADDMAGATWTAGVNPVRTKTFTYTVTETSTSDQFTYEGPKTVEVVVTDDGHGTLSAEARATTGDVSGGGQFSFENAYKSPSVDSSPSTAAAPLVYKVLEGRDMASAADGSFETYTFELRDENGALVSTGTNVAAGADGEKVAVEMEPITFTEAAYLVEGTTVKPQAKANFTLTERHTGATFVDGAYVLDGATYDTRTYTLVATIAESTPGEVSVSWEVQGNPADGAVFTNSYDATGKVNIEVQKILHGRPMLPNGFYFTLRTLGDTGMRPSYDQTLGNVASHNESDSDPAAHVRFDDIELRLSDLRASYASHPDETVSYDAASGTYTVHMVAFERTEGWGGHDWPQGVTADTSDMTTATVDGTSRPVYAIDVNVADAGDGTLSTSISYPQKDADGQALDHVLFTNDYAPDDTADAVVTINGEKGLDGRTLRAGEFTYTLEPIDGAPIRAAADALPETSRTALNGASGSASTVNFGQFYFTAGDLASGATISGRAKSKTLRYRVTEVEPANTRGVTYDVDTAGSGRCTRIVQVVLTDNGYGKLSATSQTLSGSTAEFRFRNRYVPASSTTVVTDQIDASKTLSNHGLAAGQFSFELRDSSNTVVATGANAADGSVALEPGITFSQADMRSGASYVTSRTFDYTLAERVPAASERAGVAYDSQVRTVRATVVDDGEGNLSTTWSIPGQVNPKTTFANRYNAVSADVPVRATYEQLVGDVVDRSRYVFGLFYDVDGAGFAFGSATPAGRITQPDGSVVGSVTPPTVPATATQSAPFNLATLRYTTEFLAGLADRGVGEDYPVKAMRTAGDATYYTIGYRAVNDASVLGTAIGPAPDCASSLGVTVTLKDDGLGTITTESVVYESDPVSAHAHATTSHADFLFDYDAVGSIDLYATQQITGRAIDAEELTMALGVLDQTTGKYTPIDLSTGSFDGPEWTVTNPQAASMNASDVAKTRRFDFGTLAQTRSQLESNRSAKYVTKITNPNGTISYKVKMRAFEVVDPTAVDWPAGADVNTTWPAGVTPDVGAIDFVVIATDDNNGHLYFAVYNADETETLTSLDFTNIYAPQTESVDILGTTTLHGRRAISADEDRFNLRLFYAGTRTVATNNDGTAFDAVPTSIYGADGTTKLADSQESERVTVANVTYTPEFLRQLVAQGYAKTGTDLTGQGADDEGGLTTQALGTFDYRVDYEVREVEAFTAAGRGLAVGDTLGANVKALVPTAEVSVYVKVENGKPTETNVVYESGDVAQIQNEYATANVRARIASTVTIEGGSPRSGDFTVTGRFVNTDGERVDDPLPEGTTTVKSAAASDSAETSNPFTLLSLPLSAAFLNSPEMAGIVTKTVGADATGDNEDVDRYQFTVEAFEDTDAGSIPANVKPIQPTRRAVVTVLEDLATGALVVSELQPINLLNKSVAVSEPAVIRGTKTLMGNDFAAEKGLATAGDIAFSSESASFEQVATPRSQGSSFVSTQETSRFNEVSTVQAAPTAARNTTVAPAGPENVTVFRKGTPEGGAFDGAADPRSVSGLDKFQLVAQAQSQNRALDAGEFTFELRYADGDDTSTVLATAKNASGGGTNVGDVVFDGIRYGFSTAGKAVNLTDLVASGAATVNEAGDTWTIRYRITEVARGDSYMLQDNTEAREVTVTVKQEASGSSDELVATVSGNDFNFTNTYIADKATVAIDVTVKDVGGGHKLTASEYTYTLTPTGENAAVAPSATLSGLSTASEGLTTMASTQSLDNDADGNALFGNLVFDYTMLGGQPSATFTYLMTQSQNDPVPGATYDTSRNISIFVRDDGEGHLIATRTVTGATADLNFTNRFPNAPKPATITLTPTVRDNGGHKLSAGEYTYTLTDENGNVVATATNDADGNVSLPDIVIDIAKMGNRESATFTYALTQTVEDRVKNARYDTKRTITVTAVNDGSGKIKATYTIGDGEDDSLEFVNTYPAPAAITVRMLPTVKDVGRTLTAGSYSYTVKATGKYADIAPVPDPDTALNSGSGEIVFGDLTFDYSMLGGESSRTFTYVITQTAVNPVTGATYDTSRTFEITVTNDGDSLSYEAKVLDGNKSLDFVNTFDGSAPGGNGEGSNGNGNGSDSFQKVNGGSNAGSSTTPRTGSTTSPLSRTGDPLPILALGVVALAAATCATLALTASRRRSRK